MPFETGKDKKGCWVRWGKRGTKYHYACNNTQARARAKAKAERQRKAIEANR